MLGITSFVPATFIAQHVPYLGMPLLAQSVPLSPLLIMVLCVVAGVGTVLLLPSRRETSWRKIGAVVLLAAGLILTALLVRLTAGSPDGGMGPYFWIFAAIALIGAIRVVTHSKPVYSALYFILTVFASAGLFLLLWAEFMAVALILIYAGAILVTYVFVIMLAAEAAPLGAMTRGLEHDEVSRDPVIAAAIGFVLMGVMLFVIFDKAQGSNQDVSQALNTLLQSKEITAEVFTAPTTQPSNWDFHTGPNAELNWSNWKDNPNVVKQLNYSYQQPKKPVVTGNTQELGIFLFQKHLINVELAGLILTISMIGAIVIARRRVIGDSLPLTGGETLTAPATPIDDNPHSIPVVGTWDARQKEYPET